jgi:hypothetical protein
MPISRLLASDLGLTEVPAADKLVVSRESSQPGPPVLRLPGLAIVVAPPGD